MKKYAFLNYNYSLVLILFCGFLLRIIGVNFGLPFLYYPDEYHLIEHALQFGTGDLNPRFFDWPANVIMYFYFILYGLYYVVLKLTGSIHSPTDFALMFWKDPTTFYLIARSLTAVVSTFSIYLTYKIGELVYGKKAGIISALFIALSYLYVRDSHYAMCDIYLIFFLLLSVFFFLRFSQSSKWKHLIIASVFWGLATASKYGGSMLFLTLVVSVGANYRAIQKRFDGRALAIIVVCSLIAVVTFFIVTPYALLDYDRFIKTFLFMREYIQGNFGGYQGVKLGFHVEYSGYLWLFTQVIPQAVGVFSAVFLIAGTLYSLAEKRERKWILASFPIAFYLLVLGPINIFFPRYAFPLLPFMSIWGATFLLTMLEKMPVSRVVKRVVLVVFLMLLLGNPLVRIIRLDMALSGTDTRTQARNWILTNIPAGKKIALESFENSPQFESKGQYLLRFLDQNNKYIKYMKVDAPRTKYDFDYMWTHNQCPTTDILRRDGVDYIVLSSHNYGRYFTNYATLNYPNKPERVFYQEVMNSLPLIKEFKQPASLDSDRFHSPSPTIKIYVLH